MIKIIAPFIFLMIFTTSLSAQTWVPKAENSEFKISVRTDACFNLSVVLFNVKNLTGQIADAKFYVSYDDKSMNVDQELIFEAIPAGGIMIKNCEESLLGQTGYNVIFPDGSKIDLDKFHVRFN